MSHQVTFAFVWIQLTLAAIFFCTGMFPIKNISGNQSSIDDLPVAIGKARIEPTEIYKQHINKLVIMVVDAMRYDFVKSDSNVMPYLTKSLKSTKNCISKVKVEAPTVTMPRIKALMSGSIPGYSDVVMNFMTQKTLVDNLLFQAKNKGLRSIFYGDKTWLDLYPNEFIRSEGTTSFMVSDYVEVDTNVTRNVVKELQRTDWDIMILHYLGLDHIGHLEGPFSSLVKPKLKEMDNMISLIHDFIIKMEQRSEKVVLLICSDHGMKDTGGHGGSSDPEVFVPYVFLNYECNPQPRNSIINQIDITPFLSVLLGIPIPSDSVGMLHYRMLSELDLKAILYVMHYNTIHLKKIFTQYETNSELLNTSKIAEEMFEVILNSDNVSSHYKLLETYHSVQEGMSSFIIKKSVEYNDYVIWLAMCLLFELIICVFTKCRLSFTPFRFVLFTISSVVFIGLAYLDAKVAGNSLVFQTHYVLLILIIINLCFLVPTILPIELPELPRGQNLYLIILITTYAASLASTSFIEEEHLFWYFIFSTFLFFKMRSDKISSIIMLIAHSIFRDWNNTGAKDPNNPNIGDWLNQESNSFWLFLFYSGALLAILIWCHVFIIKRSGAHSLLQKVVTICLGIKIARILLIKASYGAIKLSFLKGMGYKSLVTFWMIFCLQLLVFTLSSFYVSANAPHFNSRRRYFMMHVMDGLLLLTIVLLIFVLKPHNVFVILFILVSSEYIAKSSGGDPLQFTFYHFALGFLCFFYQGNSNNLATVDVSVGFIGQKNPDFLLSGLLVYINTHASQILSTVLLLHSLYTEDRVMRHQHEVFSISTILCTMYLFCYCSIIIFQRQHLFIWSVFSPKLLYAVSSVILHCTILLLVVLTDLCYLFVYKDNDGYLLLEI